MWQKVQVILTGLKLQHKLKDLFSFSIFSVLLTLVSQASSQTIIAVIDFEGKGVSETEASALTDRLRDELFKIGGFRLIERQQMEEILEEQGFQQTGCVAAECAVEVGKMIGAEQTVVGSISKVGNVFSVSARIVSVETGEIVQLTTYDYEGDIGGLLKTGMKEVADQLAIVEEPVSVPAEVMGEGTVYINTVPSGAAVWIDDVQIDGITPLIAENQPARDISDADMNPSSGQSERSRPGERIPAPRVIEQPEAIPRPTRRHDLQTNMHALEQAVRTALRTEHYALKTEKAYWHWIREFAAYHHGKRPSEMGGPEIHQFLSHLAINKRVAASTQNQALNAIVFLYR